MSGATIFTKTQEKKADGTVVEHFLDAGSNPPDGVLVTYYLKEKPEVPVTLTFLDRDGNEIKTFKSEEKKPEAGGAEARTANCHTRRKTSRKCPPNPASTASLGICATRTPRASTASSRRKGTCPARLPRPAPIRCA